MAAHLGVLRGAARGLGPGDRSAAPTARPLAARGAPSFHPAAGAAAARPPLRVVVVGAGHPLRSMGWQHMANVVEGHCGRCYVSDVVEPYFLSAAAATDPAAAEFERERQALPSRAWEGQPPIRWHASCDELPELGGGGPVLAVCAVRTRDAADALRQLCEKGVTHVYLEKPGAESAAQLAAIRDVTEAHGVQVTMGFNKNVSDYVQRSLSAAAARPPATAAAEGGAAVTLLQMNDYKPEELDECFERNSEGMLRNMAIHELALAVTYWGLCVPTPSPLQAFACPGPVTRGL